MTEMRFYTPTINFLLANINNYYIVPAPNLILMQLGKRKENSEISCREQALSLQYDYIDGNNGVSFA